MGALLCPYRRSPGAKGSPLFFYFTGPCIIFASFWQRLCFIFQKRGYTQEQFAELIGKSWSFISQIEANNGASIKGISLDTLFTISEKLEVPVDRFFSED